MGDTKVETVVTVPTEDEDEDALLEVFEAGAPTHTEIQWRLLDLGSKMGLNIWRLRTTRQNVERKADLRDPEVTHRPAHSVRRNYHGHDREH